MLYPVPSHLLKSLVLPPEVPFIVHPCSLLLFIAAFPVLKRQSVCNSNNILCEFKKETSFLLLLCHNAYFNKSHNYTVVISQQDTFITCVGGPTQEMNSNINTTEVIIKYIHCKVPARPLVMMSPPQQHQYSITKAQWDHWKKHRKKIYTSTALTTKVWCI